MFKFFLKKINSMAHKLRLFLFFFALSSSIFASKNLSQPMAVAKAVENLTPSTAEKIENLNLFSPSNPLESEKINAANPTMNGIENLNASGTSITSDKLEVSFNGDQTELFFSGSVKVNSPEFSVECVAAKITTFGNSMALPQGSNALLESIKQISITGPLNLNYGERSCSADHAEITTIDTTAILSGNATAKDKMGTVSGSEIRVNYKTKSVEILSGSPNEPVTVNVPATPFDGKDISSKIMPPQGI
ncbi:MAG: LptA/OstA family protein [Puniceicoccales bacterium]|jgi:lipopolysaccharide export system protein LptA|nr:LptA/OstA family protein [Puniceicoccales bacterium]